MKRHLLFVATVILLLILAACDGSQATEPAAAPREAEPEMVQPDTAVSEPEQEEAEPAVEEVPLQEVKHETAAKPQLIEFYAEW
jgi:thiol:disulfide interchange protein